MPDHSVPRVQGAKRGAQYHFAKNAQRDTQLRQERENSKATYLAKMARLLALRLARDAAKS
jgi:hypothetical protein